MGKIIRNETVEYLYETPAESKKFLHVDEILERYKPDVHKEQNELAYFVDAYKDIKKRELLFALKNSVAGQVSKTECVLFHKFLYDNKISLESVDDMLFDVQAEVVGNVDTIVKNEKGELFIVGVHIGELKERKSKYKEPISLPDSDIAYHALRLSIYKHLIEKLDDVVIKGIRVVELTDTYKVHSLKYDEDIVISILKPLYEFNLLKTHRL